MNLRLIPTGTVSSIPMKNKRHLSQISPSQIRQRDTEPWYSFRQEAHRKIMNTDILCEIDFHDGQEELAVRNLEELFLNMERFEERYSRFKKDNLLWQWNHSQSMKVDAEFFELLAATQYFYRQTGGLFDPSILPVLEKEGYTGAPYQPQNVRTSAFSTLSLDRPTLTTKKPLDLLVDLGGIGKGYVVDQEAKRLDQHFDNFLIDAGGDIYARGVNQKEGYPYWAVAVEHPLPDHESSALLLLSDMAVATSGRNRRHWKKDGEEKHHLINPLSERSAQGDYLSVTVIAGSTVAADVLAKWLFIAGREQAPLLAERFRIPAIFVTDDGTVTLNHFAQAYVWKAH